MSTMMTVRQVEAALLSACAAQQVIDRGWAVSLPRLREGLVLALYGNS